MHTGRRGGRPPAVRVRNGIRSHVARPARNRARGGAGRTGRVMNEQLTYEQALEKLDQKLKLLEDGDLTLEDALKAGDEARGYLKICTERLEAARKKIEIRAGPAEGRPPHPA